MGREERGREGRRGGEGEEGGREEEGEGGLDAGRMK